MKETTFSFIDLFAGIGGMRLAFERLGGHCVFSSEWDKHCQKTYAANFGEVPAGDITKIASRDIPRHDILLAGFPCQSFSIIGNGKGFADTRGTMFFEIERVLNDKRPSAFLLENVKQLVSHDKGRTFRVIVSRLNKLGYYAHWKILNALDFGLPQKRERILIVGFRENLQFSFPKQKKEKPSLRAFLEDHKKVDQKYFASKNIVQKRLEKAKEKAKPTPSIWHENKGGDIGIHEHSCALRSNASHNYLLVDGIRRLTPRESLLLQGFPMNFKIVVSDAQIKKQTGNAVPINMIHDVGREMLKALNREPLSPIIEPKPESQQTILAMGET